MSNDEITKLTTDITIKAKRLIKLCEKIISTPHINDLELNFAREVKGHCETYLAATDEPPATDDSTPGADDNLEHDRRQRIADIRAEQICGRGRL